MLNIVGTIKIDSYERQGVFFYNLQSLAPIAHMLRWHLNISGRHALWARNEIAGRWDGDRLTIGDDVPIYFRQRWQMAELDRNSSVFLWQEDHWFLCPHPNLFLYLLEAYENSDAEALNITHLTAMWERKHLLPAVHDAHLYTTRLVNSKTQADLWARYPSAYLIGIPNIYRWQLASDILEFKRKYMSMISVPGFELSPATEEGPAFLRDRSYREMIPKFHVFREVSIGFHGHPAACDMSTAVRWIALRDGEDVFGGHPDHP